MRSQRRRSNERRAGDLAGGEQVLVDYYDEETLRLGIGRMRAVKAFLPRMPLAEKALIDYP